MASFRVLIADDDPLALQMMRDGLAKLSVAVLEARDGEEVMRLAKAECPDLILLDVLMPRMDGFQAAALLKQDPATAEIPVIFVSALGTPKDKVRGLNLGAEDYVAKPIHPEELRARVQMVLRRIQPSRRAVPMASGQLEAMNLPSLIQMFEGERRTARLLLARGEANGEIIFEDGRIIRAAQGARKGKAAVYQLLTWREGTFQMAPPAATSQVGGLVDLSVQAVVMEGMRRLDEVPGLRSSLVDPPMRLDVPADLRQAIQAEARPDAAAVISLLDGTRKLDEILAQSLTDDWTTLKILRSFQKSTEFNLTAQGVFIRTAVPFDIGERVMLRFQLPGQNADVNVIGQVVWRNADPSKPGGLGMGIQFTDLGVGDRETIERHLVQAIAIQLSNAAEGP